MVFGQAKSTEKDLTTRYGLENFPSLLVFKSRDDSAPQKFEDTISPEALDSFFGSIVGPVEGSNTEEQSEEETKTPPPPTARARPPKKEVILQGITSDKVEEVCQNNYCIIGIVDAENGEIKEPHKTVLGTILAKFKTDDKLLFTWVDRSTSSSLLTKFTLPDAPALVVYNAKRKRFLVSDSFEAPAIIQTIERVLTGDAVYKNCE